MKCFDVPKRMRTWGGMCGDENGIKKIIYSKRMWVVGVGSMNIL